MTVTDTAGNTATRHVDITFPAVAKGDQTLTGFAYSPASVTYGDTAPAVTEPGGVRTTLSYSAAPATVCTVDAATGALTLVGVGDCNITATAAPSDDYNQGTATYTVAVAAAGTLVLNLDTIAGDDTVNSAEKAAGFAISGATGSQGGVSVTVTVGTTELTATSAAADPATWSVDVPPGASYITGTSVTVTVSASKTGYTSPSDVTRALAVDLAAPSATYTAPSSLQVGVAIGAMTPSTTDTDIASYGATGLPPGLGIDSATGAISGTPDTADANTADATVTVTDTAGNTATVDITFPAVAKGDQTLTGFAYSPASVTYGDTAPAVTAPGGVQTTLAYSATPATVCTVDASTGALTLAGVGACVITATAAGTADYNEATAAFTVTVQAAGALALNLDTIAGDDTVNSAEKAAGFAISGATGSEGGVSVTVTVGSTPLTATSATGRRLVGGRGGRGFLPHRHQRGGDGEREQDRVHAAERRDAHSRGGPGRAFGDLHGALVAAGGGGRRRHDAEHHGHRHRLLRRHGSAARARHRQHDGRDQRHPGHRRREHRRRHGDGDRHRRQHRHGRHHLPRGGQGGPDADGVRLQPRLGHLRRGRPGGDGAGRGADHPVVLGHAGHGVHGGRGHRRPDPGGGGRLRDHRHRGAERRLQPGDGHLHGHGGGGGHAGAEPRHHCR